MIFYQLLIPVAAASFKAWEVILSCPSSAHHHERAGDDHEIVSSAQGYLLECLKSKSRSSGSTDLAGQDLEQVAVEVALAENPQVIKATQEELALLHGCEKQDHLVSLLECLHTHREDLTALQHLGGFENLLKIFAYKTADEEKRNQFPLTAQSRDIGSAELSRFEKELEAVAARVHAERKKWSEEQQKFAKSILCKSESEFSTFFAKLDKEAAKLESEIGAVKKADDAVGREFTSAGAESTPADRGSSADSESHQPVGTGESVARDGGAFATQAVEDLLGGTSTTARLDSLHDTTGDTQAAEHVGESEAVQDDTASSRRSTVRAPTDPVSSSSGPVAGSGSPSRQNQSRNIGGASMRRLWGTDDSAVGDLPPDSTSSMASKAGGAPVYRPSRTDDSYPSVTEGVRQRATRPQTNPSDSGRRENKRREEEIAKAAPSGSSVATSQTPSLVQKGPLNRPTVRTRGAPGSAGYEHYPHDNLPAVMQPAPSQPPRAASVGPSQPKGIQGSAVE